MPSENFVDLLTKIALHFQNKSADSPVFVSRLVRENLFGEWIHARRCFARAYRAHDGDTCKEGAFWNDQPVRRFRRELRARMVQLANNKRKFGPFPRVWVEG